MQLFLSSISQGLLWSIMAIGVYLTFRILDIPDLTAEGSYPLGAAIVAICIVNGLNPVLSTFLAFVGGALAGSISGLVHTKLKIPPLLTGIISLTALYSINLKIMGRANLSLLRQETLVTQLQKLGLSKVNSVLFLGVVVVAVVLVLLVFLLNTQIGLIFRSTGDNIIMSEANGVNVKAMKILGYMLSNGLIALSGGLLAQNNGYADLNSGVGTIVIGLASIIISEVIIKNVSLWKRLLTIILGSVIYRLIILTILSIPSMDADLVKLFSAILLSVVLYIPQFQKNSPFLRGERRR